MILRRFNANQSRISLKLEDFPTHHSLSQDSIIYLRLHFCNDSFVRLRMYGIDMDSSHHFAYKPSASERLDLSNLSILTSMFVFHNVCHLFDKAKVEGKDAALSF